MLNEPLPVEQLHCPVLVKWPTECVWLHSKFLRQRLPLHSYDASSREESCPDFAGMCILCWFFNRCRYHWRKTYRGWPRVVHSDYSMKASPPWSVLPGLCLAYFNRNELSWSVSGKHPGLIQFL